MESQTTMADVKKAVLSAAATVAMGLAASTAQANPYVAGDMHNHNTCTDGSVSVGYSIDRAVGTGTAAAGGSNFGLDWFTIGNHGGSGNRDCRFTDPTAADGETSLGAAEVGTATAADGVTPRATLWNDTLGQTIQGTTVNALLGTNAAASGNMWRWQNIEQVEYPIVQQHIASNGGKTIIEGLEWIAPAHEHIDVAIITGQFPRAGVANANAIAEFEFRFDKADGDLVGALDASGNQLWSGKDSVDNAGTNGHLKSVRGVAWLQQNYPLTSYAIPTHTERKGPYAPSGPTTDTTVGFNIENFRDYNNAGPTVAFGIEAPGHMPQGGLTGGSGSYGSGAVGGGTYGFSGAYTAKVGGLWDGMLGEGRNFFIYGSSDWHNRGIFPANSASSTGDFQPGEFTKLYVPTKTGVTGQLVLDGMRSGNSYTVNGNLIGADMSVSARVGTGRAVTMGQTLVVNPGDKITYTVRLVLPVHNNSPYTFNNPLLTQISLSRPLNTPLLDHLDIITGNITGLVGPGTAGYAVPNLAGIAGYGIVYNPSTVIAQQLALTVARITPNADGSQTALFTTTLTAPANPFYIRLRGTNLPVSLPNATDSSGNPLIDYSNAAVVCSDPACPAHLAVNAGGQKVVTYDVQAWSNLWFYANPIFVRPSTYPMLQVEKNALLARSLRGTTRQ
jgi:hypothetical protein